MEGLDAAIERVASGIRERETARKKFSESLRRMKSSVEIREMTTEGSELLEETLFVRMKDILGGFSAKVAGVDGGLLAISCHGADVIVTRAVGVVFTYSGGRLSSCEYFPKKTPELELAELPGAQDADVRLVGGLHRTLREVECAISCARKFCPDFLVMHGPVGPHISTKPDRSSPARALYDRLNSAYLELYGCCGGMGIALFGVVEDSRGGRFSELASANFLPGIPGLPGTQRDTALLFDALEHGERTFAFKYAMNPAEHPVLPDLKEWAGKLYSFYAKTAECDRPVRVDFPAFDGRKVGEQAERIASALFSMSHWNRMYGLPPVLIEADCRARLSEEEGEFIRERIADRVGNNSPLVLGLRREGRPF